MSKNKISDEDALNELKAWCKPFGLEVLVYSYKIIVCWIDPKSPNQFNGTSVVINENRPKIKSYYSYNNPKYISVSTTCQKIINKYFKNKRYLHWSRKSIIENNVYAIENLETVSIRIPEANTPAEMEIKLAINGWTGNPFGLSAGLLKSK
jgi:hypothetical protein